MFAASCAQSRSLNLMPWQLPPYCASVADLSQPPGDVSGRRESAELKKRLIDANLSIFEPDPLHMISLSDDELQTLMTAARPLAPADRAEFLQTVAAELSRFEIIGPGTVGRVCASAQRRFFAAPSLRGASGKWNR